MAQTKIGLARNGNGDVYDVAVRNLSPGPIYDVLVSLTAPDTVDIVLPQSQPHLNAESYAGFSFVIALKDRPRRVPYDMPQAEVAFREADGYLWSRRATGELTPPVNAIVQGRVRRRVYRSLPDAWVRKWLARPNRPPVRLR